MKYLVKDAIQGTLLRIEYTMDDAILEKGKWQAISSKHKAVIEKVEEEEKQITKTYYLIKAYAARYIQGEHIERYNYFGKSNKLLGYITESGVERYTKDDIRNHGYRSYRKAMDAAEALRHEECDPGWTVVITLIAETV